ncbi:hypothetical protein M885DRAFT_524495 [Pelagophyceae sp. CCMP2097]|nr:hypothetical protein M885DRAFT_524495 [Pelagophyceae sp. CCMP2097]
MDGAPTGAHGGAPTGAMDGARDDDGAAHDGAARDDDDCGADDAVVLFQGRGLSAVPGWVAQGLCLRHLNLSFNKLTSIDALSSLTALLHLNVSHNRLGSLRGIEGLTMLKVLKAQSNSIRASVEHCEAALAPVAELALVELWVGGNAVCDPWEVLGLRRLSESLQVLQFLPSTGMDGLERYREFIVAILPNLRHLDESPIDDSDRGGYGESVDGRGVLHRLKADFEKWCEAAHKQTGRHRPNDGPHRRPDKARAALAGPDKPAHGRRRPGGEAQASSANAQASSMADADFDESASEGKNTASEGPLADARSNGGDARRRPSPAGRRPTPAVAEYDGKASIRLRDARNASIYSENTSIADAVAQLPGSGAEADQGRAPKLFGVKPRKPLAKGPKGASTKGAPTARRRRPAWPAAPASFPTLMLRYDSQQQLLAVVAVGGTDGSVVLRWPKGSVAVSLDAGSIRAFHESGLLAVTCDAAGNGSVSASSGRLLLSLNADGGGFLTDDDGSIKSEWPAYSKEDSSKPAKPGLVEFVLPAADGEAQLGVAVDTGNHFAVVFFHVQNIKCKVSQSGGVEMLPQVSDIFGRPLAPEVVEDRANAAKVLKATQLQRAAPRSHDHLISKIRGSIAGL